jgi:peptidyl-prolyl cis-trans isomerase A (cyclophilin A)
MTTIYRFGLVALLVATGCKKESSTEAPKPAKADDMKPEPVGKDPNGSAMTQSTQPSPDPTPAAGLVRKPTKDDLATYTKDLPGTGAKLLAQFDTSQGTIHCELFGDKAPMTVANFIGLATGKKAWMNPKTGNVEQNKPYFDGLMFHRVIPGFMIQGGDPLGQGIGGPGYNFGNEFVDDLQMSPGTLAMANAGDGPDGGGTNGSQFFIMEGARPDLVHKHTIFGKCKELDIVKKITGVPTGENDRPQTAVTIDKLTISKG